MKRLLVVLMAAALAACGSDAADPVAEKQTDTEALMGATLPRGADLSQAPASEIDFYLEYDYSDGEPKPRYWSEAVRGPLYAGGTLTLQTVETRFPTCGFGGTVSAGVKLDDGTTLDVPLDQGVGQPQRWGSVTLPQTARSVEIWFKAQNGDCVEYDSDFGNNYRYEVNRWAPTLVHFRGDWTEQADGTLQKGGALVVDYDISRLPRCRINYRGFPSWFIKAWARFDDGSLYQRNIVEFRYGQQGTPEEFETMMAVFPIPATASSVELWFENDEYPPLCHDWDSDYGNNYRYEVR